MSQIEVAAPLLPGTVDTPLDARSRVAALSDIGDIANPSVGLLFYVRATGRTYRVRSLKSKRIGAITVANAAIDEYEVMPDASDLEGIGSAGILLLPIPADLDGDRLHFQIVFSDQADFADGQVTDTRNNRVGIEVFATGSFVAFPEVGVDDQFYNSWVRIDRLLVAGGGRKYYRWRWHDGSAWQDWCPTPVGKAAGTGAKWLNGNGVPANTLGSDGDQYLDGASGDIYAKANGVWGKTGNIKGGSGTVAVVLVPQLPSDVSGYPDGTIFIETGS